VRGPPPPPPPRSGSRPGKSDTATCGAFCGAAPCGAAPPRYP
jgi:hypothetical protein